MPPFSRYLLLTVAEDKSHGNDMIMIPADVWSSFDDACIAPLGEPVWVELDHRGATAMGRVVPATPQDGLAADACRIPVWMWRLLGSPAGTDDDMWVSVSSVAPTIASRIVLRARREADVLALADPVVALTAAFTGEETGATWTCLNAGAELPLSCGVFDVIEVYSADGVAVPAASIMDMDLSVEFVPALDHVEPVPPAAPTAPPVPPPDVPSAGPKGFVPFSGKGYRLQD